MILTLRSKSGLLYSTRPPLDLPQLSGLLQPGRYELSTTPIHRTNLSLLQETQHPNPHGNRRGWTTYSLLFPSTWDGWDGTAASPMPNWRTKITLCNIALLDLFGTVPTNIYAKRIMPKKRRRPCSTT